MWAEAAVFEPMRPRWRSTYRLQLTPDFGFESARRLLPYLARLGVSHLYLSPILEARAGSAHGYDVTDPRRVREELGGESAFVRLCDEAHGMGLGILVDIVPNHMAASPQGEPFRDVLTRGEESVFARWFDIDFSRHANDRRIVLPWLSDEDSVEFRFARGENGIELDLGERLPFRGIDEIPTDEGAAAALELQAYRLVPWRSSGGRRNYRRYLDLDHLIGVRVEDPEVLFATHEKILSLVAGGSIDGLRIDHLDGLSDPVGYLKSIKSLLPDDVAIFAEATNAAEALPCGTTGYDFLQAITTTLLSDSARITMRRVFTDCHGNGDAEEAAEVMRACEHVASEILKDEFDSVLAALAADPATGALADLRAALLKCCAGEADVVIQAVLDRSPRLQRIVRYVRSKAVEDTFYWREVSLLAERELGMGPPCVAAAESSPLRELLARRDRAGGISLNSTSTHDTKRSEDVRARLIALAPHAEELASIVGACDVGFRRHEFLHLEFKDMWFVLCELIGAWPIESALPGHRESFASRMDRHLEKAAREAKQRSSWPAPDREYERTLARFARFVIEDTRDEEGSEWRSRFLALRERVAGEGSAIGLIQSVLKFTMPGVADIYQGCEGIALNLVDPDNRRPVEFAHQVAELDALERLERSCGSRSELVAALLADPSPERLKRFVIRECLAWQRDVADAFDRSPTESWKPPTFRDPRIFFDRHGKGRSMVVLAAPPWSLAPGLEESIVQLPFSRGGVLTDRFTHRVFHPHEWYSLKDVIGPLGVALLDAKAP